MRLRVTLFVLLCSAAAILFLGQASIAGELTAQEILDKADFQNQAQDRSANLKMVLIDKDGKQSLREVRLWLKGDNRRLIKFLSPADVKGVGFLVLNSDTPNEKMYLYLPAFKKIRRIAGSAKSGSFMGSDFSYDDIGSSKYSQDYNARRLPDQNGQYLLDLTRKAGADTEYDKLKVWIAADTFIPTKVEFYNLRSNNVELMKTMTAANIAKFGNYWTPQKITMDDIKKKHQTVLEMTGIKMDTGLSDSIFSERNLER